DRKLLAAQSASRSALQTLSHHPTALHRLQRFASAPATHRKSRSDTAFLRPDPACSVRWGRERPKKILSAPARTKFATGQKQLRPLRRARFFPSRLFHRLPYSLRLPSSPKGRE